MTLNVENMERWQLKVLERICTTTLNAKLKKDGDLKCMNGYEKWL